MRDIKVILDTAYDAVSRCQSGPTHQWNAQSTQGVFLRRQGCDRSYSAIPGLSTTGLSLYPGSSSHRESFAHSRTKDSFHREASFPLGSSLPPIGQNNRRIFERAGAARFGVFSPEGRAWLRSSSQSRFNFSITLTDWPRRNCCRPMNSWSLRRRVPKERTLTREV